MKRRSGGESNSREDGEGNLDDEEKDDELFLRTMISGMEKVYLSRNSTAKAILELVRKDDGDHICYDHFAFRTFGVDGYGIDSMAKIFLYFGYKPREELRFPAKKLKALWFAPPDTGYSENGTGVHGPLPRIFISELLVDQLSYQSQVKFLYSFVGCVAIFVVIKVLFSFLCA
ncbi:hypothetical protein C4D60_Mb10t28950 [Musa balbisiana]|uniref:2-oxoadipate dioxygenase/decarboxylase n=1 Tax=Musa balbisiana TaxID=52838 RepID=A0A4S8J0H2_MUSBA|nr:hypothetical protein C4D60_Mb10t28950 [Musa balbisiana]